MSRIMGDSTVLRNIPRDVDIAATYINGHEGVSTKRELEAIFPNHLYGHCWIDVDGSRPDADVRDWETGDKGGSLELWVKDHNAHTGKLDAVVYANRSTIPEVRQLTGSQRLGIEYYLFVACLDGTMYEGPGVKACQRDGAEQTGGDWDRTFVFDDDWCKAIPLVGKPNCMAFERALHAPANNQWDDRLDLRVKCIQAVSQHAKTYPKGIKFTQQVVGAYEDGIWGPDSDAALAATVMSAQMALTHMGFPPVDGADGIWGPNTTKACTEARRACHV